MVFNRWKIKSRGQTVKGIKNGPFFSDLFRQRILVAEVNDKEGPIYMAADCREPFEKPGQGPHKIYLAFAPAVELDGVDLPGKGPDPVFGNRESFQKKIFLININHQTCPRLQIKRQ
jgi:hypothetical protein